MTSLLTAIKEAFDNDSTPFYAVIICIWGTVFLELWKRKNAVLAYEWDVHDFEDIEPDRPEYFGKEPSPLMHSAASINYFYEHKIYCTFNIIYDPPNIFVFRYGLAERSYN